MKKGIITLLIVALVASCAFAGTLKGAAQIDFGYNLDTTDWGFKNSSVSNYTFSFEYDTTKVEVADHSTEIWAEIAANASAKISQANAGQDKANIAVTTAITKANIHVGEWTFGILGSGATLDLASSYYLNSSKKPVDNTIQAVSGVYDGFTVSYKDWNGGFGAKGNIEGKAYNFYGHVETPTFKFADEAVSVNAGAYLVYSDSDSYAGASAKAAYKADDLSASVAVDGKYDNGNVLYEVAAKAAYKFVTVDAYVTPGAMTVDAAKYTGDNAKTPSVNAKVAASYDFDIEDVAVAVEGAVDARNLLVDAREITVGAAETCTIDAFEVEVAESYAVFANVLDLSETVTYTAEKFTAFEECAIVLAFDINDVVVSVPFKCGISSDAIVENAELSLVYAGLNFKDVENHLGTITASAKIAF
ncbi:MAG: hypothetical protein MJ057_00450 [Sphaerochaetaceae bacterium]|nr:hypothetical protein [Sphaerochaetaceae bacterium]